MAEPDRLRRRIPATSDRDEWIDNTTAVLLESMAELGYSAKECRVLAGVMLDIDPGAAITKRQPGYAQLVIRQAMFTLQGLDGQAAAALSQLIRLADLTRTIVPSRTAAQLLGVHRAQLGRYREEGKLHPATDHRRPELSGGQQLWWLDEILALLADERHWSGKAGKGSKRFPNLT